MNFDDLLGLIVFLGIVILSSIFRGLKEMKKREEEKFPKSSPQPMEKKFQESGETIPKRRVVIRRETEPVFPAPVFPPASETLETKEDLFERKEEEGKQILIKLDRKEEEFYEEPIQEPIVIEKKEKHVTLLKPLAKTFKGEYPSVSKVQKLLISAPMERVSVSHMQNSFISLTGNIGNIPKLQWAVIMMEILSPPKAMRND